MARCLCHFVVAVVVVMGLAGCGPTGPALGMVKGLVTMDSKPLPNVLVTFEPESGGRASTGKTDATGNYSLIYMDKEGAIVGKHKVRVTVLGETPQAVKEISSSDPEYEKQALGTGSQDAAKAPTLVIPEKYNAKSEMVHEVKSGENTINLELKSS